LKSHWKKSYKTASPVSYSYSDSYVRPLWDGYFPSWSTIPLTKLNGNRFLRYVITLSQLFRLYNVEMIGNVIMDDDWIKEGVCIYIKTLSLRELLQKLLSKILCRIRSFIRNYAILQSAVVLNMYVRVFNILKVLILTAMYTCVFRVVLEMNSDY
jgi:hypothetical protein